MTTESRRRFSPRPGFTLVGGLRSQIGPVVIRIDGTALGISALRTAAEQAMSRSCDLVALDGTGAEESETRFPDLDERERAIAEGILANNHVTLVLGPALSLSDLARECDRLQASLLVLSPSEVEELAGDPRTLTTILGSTYDVLMVTDTQERSRHPMAGQPTR